MWTLDHEADIASDLSAFHRIDDPLAIDGPRYFSLAGRLAAYSGVIAARVYAEHERERSGGTGAPTGGSAPYAARSDRTVVADSTALAMLSDGWVEHRKEEG